MKNRPPTESRRKGETSYKETTFGIISRSKLIPLEIEGIKKAWDFVLRSQAKGKIPQMMEDFTKDLKVRLKCLPEFEGANFLKEIVRLLSWAHHRFLWIHPFSDYNGRISRLLISMILMNLNLPPIELRVETKMGRTKYVKALGQADKGDFELLEKILHSALEEAAKKLS